MIEELSSALTYLPEGKGIHLESDVFLCGLLDGSDKLYGFKREDGELLVQTRECGYGYPVSQMDKGELDYMFKLSPVFQKIRDREYRAVQLDANGHIQSLDEVSDAVSDAFDTIKSVAKSLEDLSTNDLARARYKLKEMLEQSLSILGDAVDNGGLCLEEEDGTSGQDRESYTDEQDRASYTIN